jgi:PEP-CTERM motif
MTKIGSVLFALSILALVGPFAHAQTTTYIYTGSPFTNCYVDFEARILPPPNPPTEFYDNECPAGPGVVASITLSQPLPDNAVNYAPVLTSSAIGAAFVGINAYSYPTFVFGVATAVPTPFDRAFFSTDSSGQIIGWDVAILYSPIIISNPGEDFFGRDSCNPSVTECWASSGPPGQWVMTPEPATLLLLGTGMFGLGMGAIRRTRVRHTSLQPRVGLRPAPRHKLLETKF